MPLEDENSIGSHYGSIDFCEFIDTIDNLFVQNLHFDNLINSMRDDLSLWNNFFRPLYEHSWLEDDIMNIP